jgi:Dolichyl-phosphate-mannose-protein mannosyltransferase
LAGNLKFSSSVVDIEPRARLWTTLRKDRLALLGSLEWTVVGTLALLIVLGLGLRLNQLSAIGFAEDEMNKLEAIRAYETGDFSSNAEHPMVMKTLMLMSSHFAPTNSEEVALRLPNVLIGALTVIPLFLLTAAFFDRWTGLLAAAFWAFGINAITHNRVGKEDTLLVFFMLFAFYFFLRAKQTSPVNASTRARNYAASAAAFGMMIASKYFPHYLGLNMLYHHNFRVRKAVAGAPSGKTPGWFFLLIIGVFIVASPAVLLPQVWNYLNAYLSEHLLTHSGYLFGDHLYKNNMSSSPFWGTPFYFYLLFLAIKVPLLIVVALIIGLVVAVVRRRHPGSAFLLFMFLFWIVPYSLIGGKWLRYTLSLMPFVYMLAAVGVIALIRTTSTRVQGRKHSTIAVTAAAVLLFVGVPALIAAKNGPHYALYTNALAADKAGYFFPHDEFYDDGLREGIKLVCEIAPRGAIIAHETPGVTRYYLTKFGRVDLSSRPISAPDFDPTTAEGVVYVVVQRGRTYFENRDEIASVRARFKKVHEVMIEGRTAVEIFVNR